MIRRSVERTLASLASALAAVAVLMAAGQLGAAERWTPQPGSTWDLQFEGAVSADKAVAVLDLDLFDTPASLVAALRARGVRTICYLSAGTIEDWRPDADALPDAVVGNDYAEWPGERWLDIRRIDAIGPVMEQRLDLCRDKGFDGADPDNVDGWQQNSGFALTRADQIAYALWFAAAAHARGLAVGLKNAPELAPDLVDSFNWALTEDCFDQGWCAEMVPFIAAGKAVFALEYTDTDVDPEAFCAEAARVGLSGIVKRRVLDGWTHPCPSPD
jgi:hypothetical protein